MSNLAIKFLKKALLRSETSLNRTGDLTLPLAGEKGYPYTNNETLISFHAYLSLAGDSGAIGLEWIPHYEGEHLQRIRLLDQSLLANFLGVDLLSTKVAKSFEDISEIKVPRWFSTFLSDIHEKWISGKKAHKLKPADTQSLIDVITAVNAIESLDSSIVLDYRQFGARHLAHSKKLKEISSPLSSIYREHLDLDGLPDKDLLSNLNLVPLSHPVFISGPLVLGDRKYTVNANVRPYVGVPYELLDSIEMIRDPEYIITIENLSSFNEYTQNINENSVIIYSAGYPTRSLQKFYARLVELLPNSPLFHWGDTDPHGFQILKTFQRRVPGRIVNPHLMNMDSGSEYSKSDLTSLESLIPVNPAVDDILSSLLITKKGFYEQEVLPAQSPLIKKK